MYFFQDGFCEKTFIETFLLSLSKLNGLFLLIIFSAFYIVPNAMFASFCLLLSKSEPVSDKMQQHAT